MYFRLYQEFILNFWKGLLVMDIMLNFASENEKNKNNNSTE